MPNEYLLQIHRDNGADEDLEASYDDDDQARAEVRNWMNGDADIRRVAIQRFIDDSDAVELVDDLLRTSTNR